MDQLSRYTNDQLDNLNRDLQDLLEISRMINDITYSQQLNIDVVEEKITSADELVELSIPTIEESSEIKKSSRVKKILLIGGLTTGGILLGTAGLAISIPVAAAGMVVGAVAGLSTGAIINYKIIR